MESMEPNRDVSDSGNTSGAAQASTGKTTMDTSAEASDRLTPMPAPAPGATAPVSSLASSAPSTTATSTMLATATPSTSTIAAQAMSQQLTTDTSQIPAAAVPTPATVTTAGAAAAAAVATTATTAGATASTTVPATMPAPITQQIQYLVPSSDMPAPVVLTPEEQLEKRYHALMVAVEEIGRDIKPAYAGSRIAMERLKKSIGQCRLLVKETSQDTRKVSSSS
eukprot:scpid89336/ scgid19048/ 